MNKLKGFKVGQKIRIIGNCVYHRFRIGQIVRVRSLFLDGALDAAESLDGREIWAVNDEDVRRLWFGIF